MSGDEQQSNCQACRGTGLTEHTEHTVETDEQGNQKPVTRSWTGPCSTCHGSGVG